jgi:hypothetical protein
MTRSIAAAFLIITASVLILAASPPAFAAKKKAPARQGCTAGTLCTGPCNEARWCNVRVCSSRGTMTPTLGFCVEGSPFCPRKC